MTVLLTRTLEGYAQRLAAGHRSTMVLTYVGMVVFYALTATRNFAETDDVFAFAYRAEHFPFDNISDPRLMLYHMLMRALYLSLAAFDPAVSALPLMRGVALLSAPWVLLILFDLLARRLALRPSTALLTVAFLGLSYGFWRYAVEADVYVPAMLLLLLTLRRLLTVQGAAADPRLWSAAVLAALTVLFYQPAVLVVFGAFPLLLFSRDRLGQLLVYMAVGVALVGGGYLAAYQVSQDAPLTVANLTAFLAQRSAEFMVPALSPGVVVKSMIKSLFALGHDLVSANWVFAIDGLGGLVQRVFPANVIDEEVFAARSAGWLPWLSLFWLPALGGAVWLAWRALPGIPWARWRQRENLALVAWLALTGLVIGRLNPAGIEAWLIVLVPLFALLAVFVLEPLVLAGRVPLLLAALALYAAHNTTGGMAMMWDGAGDLDQVKGRWVIEQARENDLVVVVDDAGLAELLRYRTDARVDLIRAYDTPFIAYSLLSGEPPPRPVLTYGRDFLLQDVYAHILDASDKGGVLYVFEEFFSWDTEYAAAYAPHTAEELDLLARLRSRSVMERHAGPAGASYRLQIARVPSAAAAR